MKQLITILVHITNNFSPLILATCRVKWFMASARRALGHALPLRRCKINVIIEVVNNKASVVMVLCGSYVIKFMEL